jgi:hypothetical protein
MLRGHLLGWCCTAGDATGKQQAQHKKLCPVSLHIDHVSIKVVCATTGEVAKDPLVATYKHSRGIRQLGAFADSIEVLTLILGCRVTHLATHDVADAAYRPTV